MKRAGLLFLAGVALAAVTAAVAATVLERRQDVSFRSEALGGTLHYEVYLPADYATGDRRYPVVYFLHGLPSTGTAYKTIGFVETALDKLDRQAILVVPQGARAGEPDPEYLDQGADDGWDTAIAGELPRVVDARFRTIRSRDGRALVGVSAGGYGAMHLALEHLDEFAVVESWSGYFHPTDPTGTKPLDLGSEAKNSSADVHKQAEAAAARLKQLPTFIAFYVGRADWRFSAENEQLNQELTRAGIPHVFRLYAGGHDQRLWQRYAPEWLSLALAHLAPARAA
ncbi:MAG TPA: alpha/beta hydrolase-fold protein [Gaiellaceae bacterium]